MVVYTDEEHEFKLDLATGLRRFMRFTSTDYADGYTVCLNSAVSPLGQHFVYPLTRLAERR
jgi:hypothetical protein